jgi:fluoride exporter
MEKMMNILVVGFGGFLGSVLRYLVSLWTQSKGWTSFPWATLIVNVVGCFLITLIITIGATFTIRTNLRLFLTTGIMGGLTTYSTFDAETTKLFQNGESITAFANVGATLIACFIAGLLGIALARLVVPD